MTIDSETSNKRSWQDRAEEIKRLVRQPSYAREYFPNLLLSAWRSKGGSWYGIGYLVTFIYVEISMTIDQVMSANSMSDLVGNNLGEFITLWVVESIQNMVTAFLWPVHIIQVTGGVIGIIIIVSIHYAFEYFVRPMAEDRFPVLTEDRIARAEKKRAKKQAKGKKK